MASIQTYGYNQPVVVDGDLVIVAGDTRWRALVRIYGLDGRAPVVVNRSLSPAERREYRIIDNRTADMATWNLERLVGELRALPVDDMRPYFGDVELDRLLATLPAVPVVSASAAEQPARTGIQRDQVAVSCPCGATFYLDRQDLERRPGPTPAPGTSPAATADPGPASAAPAGSPGPG